MQGNFISDVHSQRNVDLVSAIKTIITPLFQNFGAEELSLGFFWEQRNFFWCRIYHGFLSINIA